MPVKDEQGFFTEHSPDEQPPRASNILGENKLSLEPSFCSRDNGKSVCIGPLLVGLGFTEATARTCAQSRDEEGREDVVHG